MKLPSSEELSKMSPQALIELWALVQMYKAKLAKARELDGIGPSPIEAVGDDLVRAIVADNRRAGNNGVSAPSSVLPEPTKSEPVVRGSGWQDARPIGVPSGTKYIDQMCDVQDAIDRRDLERRLKGGVL